MDSQKKRHTNREEKEASKSPEVEVKEKDASPKNADISQEELAKEEQESLEETDRLIVDQQQRINELEEELEKLKDSQLRKAAEMDNMRKRLQREREQIFQMAREAALGEFLPINDDLIRTLQVLREIDADSTYVDGVQMIANKFEDVLDKHGVQRIDKTGVPFDVDLHDAMLSQKPEDDSIEKGTVLQVLENGYKIGNKTLRHAKVIVSE